MQPPRFSQQVTFCYTPDLAAADNFYRDMLGLRLVLDQGPCHIFRVTDEAYLGFCTTTGNISPETAGGIILTLVVPGVAEVDRWADHLRLGEGAQWLERGPVLNERFNIYHLFLRDPAGHLVEIQAFLDPAWPLSSPEGPDRG